MANVALLATVGDSTASQTAGAVSSLMPSGVILPYAGSTTPAGWLVCDGTAYSQTTYANLFAALGSAYNTQVNPTTGSAWATPSAGQFRVPDMRGLFLRGEGTASGGDAVSVGGHQVGKTAKNGIAAAASGVSGSATSGGVDHVHGSQAALGSPTLVGSGGTPMLLTAGGTTTGAASAWEHTHGLSATAAAQTITGDNETRPTNRGVRYIIKV